MLQTWMDVPANIYITVHGQCPNYQNLDGQTFEFESENRVYLCKSSEIYHPRYRADPAAAGH